MREGWDESTFGETFEVSTGSTPPKARKELYGSHIVFVKPPELLGGDIYESSDGLSEIGAEQARILPVGSVLVSCIGNLGKLGVTRVLATCNQQINAVKPNRAVASPDFVFYYCQSDRFRSEIISLASGTTVPIVNKGKFCSIRIPLPPLPEQERIVAILDEAFAAIATATANAEKNLANARELFESGFESCFGDERCRSAWRVLPIDEALLSILDFRGRTPKKLGMDWGGGAIHALSALNVREGKIDHSRTKHFGSEELYSRWMNRGDAARGDIVLTTEAPMGKVAQIPDDRKYILSQRVVLLKAKPHLLTADFLAWALRSPGFQKMLRTNETGATAMGIRMATFKRLPIAFPSKQEQEGITAKLCELVSVTKRMESIFAQKLAHLPYLKQSLLHKAFTGELTADSNAAHRSLSEAGV